MIVFTFSCGKDNVFNIKFVNKMKYFNPFSMSVLGVKRVVYYIQRHKLYIVKVEKCFIFRIIQVPKTYPMITLA